MPSFIHDFGVLFLVIVVFSFLAKLLKQPIIIGYIVSGFMFSLFIAGGSTTEEQILALAELGITFLLFLMGLEFDFHNLKHLGKDIFITTALQSIIFFAVAFGAAHAVGFGSKESVYLAILFLFSSTLLVAKWLEDKKEIATLHGKITLGILIMQDVFAILILTLLNSFQQTKLSAVLFVLLKGLILIGLAIVFVRYLLNYLLKIAFRYPELLFVSSLGVCFLFVEIAPRLGYSTAIGAFIAGVTLANTEYKNDILGRLKPLIIFFNLLFFVGMGFRITTAFSARAITLMLLFLAFCFFVKPGIVYLTLKLRGYDLKTSFLTAINLAQVSEFGLIIISAAAAMGIVSSEMTAIAIVLIVITFVLSSYTIKYDALLFKLGHPFLKKIDRFFPAQGHPEAGKAAAGFHVLLFGYYDLGKEFFSRLEGLGKKTVVIENDRANISLLKQEGISYMYGSVSNPYFLDHLDFSAAEIVVSSLTDADESKMIIKSIKSRNPKATIIVTAKNVRNSLELYEAGADYVIYPSYVNEQKVSVLLEDYTTDLNKIISRKVHDLALFKDKQEKIRQTETMFSINEFMKRLSKKEGKK
ncbi:MAG TPA: cation:proton antiporter [Candidatus Nanoarchaeia archaeon]|nr:cation:proton antiporter [Candidatus Nanoarchaeia archaeon]